MLSYLATVGERTQHEVICAVVCRPVTSVVTHGELDAASTRHAYKRMTMRLNCVLWVHMCPSASGSTSQLKSTRAASVLYNTHAKTLEGYLGKLYWQLMR
jgi:hypothetical protein